MEVIFMIITAAGICMFGFVIAGFLDHYLDEGERSRHHNPFEERSSHIDRGKTFFR